LNKEINSLLNLSKSLIPETPDPLNPYDVIQTTCVLKKKMLNSTTVDKYKARICICGNQLTSKYDYNNPTYSPTVSMLTHTTLLQTSIYDSLHTASYDTIGAYLYQHYPEHYKALYVKLPTKVALACGLNPHQLYRVHKYLYGLPDSGLAYYNSYVQLLLDNGYKKVLVIHVFSHILIRTKILEPLFGST